MKETPVFSAASGDQYNRVEALNRNPMDLKTYWTPKPLPHMNSVVI